jgi:hypothetical protein
VGPGEIIAATVGALTIVGVLVAIGRWVGHLESRGTNAALELQLAELATKIEIRERDWQRHMSDHRELGGSLAETREEMKSIHDPEEKRR